MFLIILLSGIFVASRTWAWRSVDLTHYCLLLSNESRHISVEFHYILLFALLCLVANRILDIG